MPFFSTQSPSSPTRRKRELQIVQLSGMALLLLLIVVSVINHRERNSGALPRLRIFEGEAIVRVRLTAYRNSCTLRSSGPLELFMLQDQMPETHVVLSGDRDLKISFSENKVRVAGHDSEEGFELRPSEGALFTLDGTTYPGKIRLLPDSARGGIIVLFVPLETYVTHVLPREMPLSYPRAALEAQVVAIRSYAVATMLSRQRSRWDLVDTEASQVFGGHNKLISRSAKLVAGTRNQVLAFDDEVLTTYFSSTCGGHTRDNAAAFGSIAHPALHGVRCGFCDWSSDAQWIHRLDREALRKKLGLRQITAVSLLASSRGERFAELSIVGGPNEGSQKMSVKELRRHSGRGRIRSYWLTKFRLDGPEIIVEGRGFGHGVGLCQNGARGMAEAGLESREILTRYYPGASLAILSP